MTRDDAIIIATCERVARDFDEAAAFMKANGHEGHVAAEDDARRIRSIGRSQAEREGILSAATGGAA
jgi:hypothetical protein